MKESMVENVESFPVSVETMSREDLGQMVYKGELTPQDSRFLPIDKGGVFKYFFADDLDNPFQSETIYQVVSVGDKVVGLSKLQLDPYKPNNYWIQFISVDPLFQGNGYAKKLAEEMVRFAKSKGCSLEHSMLSDEGREKIFGLVDFLAEKSEVSVIHHA